MKVVLNSYPNATDIKIGEIFRPSEGWVRIWGQRLVDLTVNNVIKAKNENATHINVRLIDEFGQERFPDFTVKELLS